MKKILFFATIISIFMAVPTLAALHVDTFNATIDQTGQVTGGGTGWPYAGGPQWFYYPDTGWWNQWFYDDPPDPFRWKEITYDISIDPGGFILLPGELTIVINWSTMDFPESGPDLPPIPDFPGLDETLMINRDYEVYRGPVEMEPMNFTDTFIIPDYNPEWVSIDIMVSDPFLVLEPITITGTIWHECIPAPGAILLGSIGAGFVGWLRRRRTL